MFECSSDNCCMYHMAQDRTCFYVELNKIRRERERGLIAITPTVQVENFTALVDNTERQYGVHDNKDGDDLHVCFIRLLKIVPHRRLLEVLKLLLLVFLLFAFTR